MAQEKMLIYSLEKTPGFAHVKVSCVVSELYNKHPACMVCTKSVDLPESQQVVS